MRILRNKKLFTILAAGALFMSASIANATSISLLNATNNVVQNGTFSIDVVVDLGVEDVGTGAVDIQWTAGALNLDLVTINPLLTNFGTGSIDNLVGTVTDITAAATPSIPPFVVGFPMTGIFTLATLDFTYLGNGVPALIEIFGLDGLLPGTWVPTDSLDGITPVTFDALNSATVTLSAVPVPPAMILFVSALAGLGISGRRKVKA